MEQTIQLEIACTQAELIPNSAAMGQRGPWLQNMIANLQNKRAIHQSYYNNPCFNTVADRPVTYVA